MRILCDTEPRPLEEIFAPEDWARLEAAHDLIIYDGGDRAAFYRQQLPEVDVIVGQQAMDRDDIASAPRLKAIFNVETNFLPNIDYEACFERGIHVLAPSSVFAVPVAEMGLGMALSLARGIHTAHGDFLAGKEKYLLEGNQEAELLTHANVGFIGFGDLGRATYALLGGFKPRVRVYDPWLSEGYLRRAGVEAASLDSVLQMSKFVFVVASVTTENGSLLDLEKLSMMQPGAMLILLSRAAIADFDALKELAGSGRIRVATDVFPEEPVPPDDPIRQVPNILFSAHRAGALTSALREIGKLVLEDLDQISRGLPPVACKRAERETVGRMRSKPIEQQSTS